ncbi:MAG: YcxB family protein [Flavobacteriaceae bacterium]
MKFQYSLDENDFLINLLYRNSTSELQKKKLLRSRVLIPIIYILFATSFLYKQNYTTAIVFIIIGALWFVFYPIYSKRRTKNYYIKFIKENYTNRIGVLSILEFKPDYIFASDKGSESKINSSELEKLIEIQDYFFLDTYQKQSLIIPKKIIENLDEFYSTMANYNIELISEKNWIY